MRHSVAEKRDRHAPTVSQKPKITMLRESAARAGFFEREQYESGPFALDVRELTGVARTQEKRQDEDHADEGEVAAGGGAGVHVDHQEGDDDLEEVVVECAKELGPEEGRQSGPFQSLAVGARRHIAPFVAALGAGAAGATIGRGGAEVLREA